ncbi:unnamed protein product [Fusarium venenatum]|uniref:Uncharacterized protein n=1 Tax=Fusarium venenatum TaxID=56646 RepID=A0A2L2SPI6_9HYPO|nr:uncharacterized protein FVRRES_12467 [Fusarium venenatum]CEI39776.1 unnamed protein product [Fusarium venenatum]
MGAGGISTLAAHSSRGKVRIVRFDGPDSRNHLPRGTISRRHVQMSRQSNAGWWHKRHATRGSYGNNSHEATELRLIVATSQDIAKLSASICRMGHPFTIETHQVQKARWFCQTIICSLFSKWQMAESRPETTGAGASASTMPLILPGGWETMLQGN